MNIRHKRSDVAGVTPALAELTAGEIAINTADAKLFTRKADGTVAHLNPTYAAVSHTHSIPDVQNLVGDVWFSPLGATHRIFPAENATAFAASALTANRLLAHPFVAKSSFTATSIKLSATTGVASSTFALGIYASGTDGWPTGTPLVTSGTLSGAGAIELSATISLAITRGTQYWMAVIASATAPTVRRYATGAAVSLGQTSAANAHAVSLLRTITFPTWPDFTAAPTTAADLSTTVPAAIMITT
jgi:hypothetical protein